MKWPEQWINLNFLVKFKQSQMENYCLLTEVHKDDCMSCTPVFEWYKRFGKGQEEVEDSEYPSRPSTSKTDTNIKKVKQTIQNDQCLSIWITAGMVKIDKGTVWQILHDQTNFVQKWTPKFSLCKNKNKNAKTLTPISWNEYKSSHIS